MHVLKSLIIFFVAVLVFGCTQKDTGTNPVDKSSQKDTTDIIDTIDVPGNNGGSNKNGTEYNEFGYTLTAMIDGKKWSATNIEYVKLGDRFFIEGTVLVDGFEQWMRLAGRMPKTGHYRIPEITLWFIDSPQPYSRNEAADGSVWVLEYDEHHIRGTFEVKKSYQAVGLRSVVMKDGKFEIFF